MTARYEGGFAKNVFRQLDTECSLCVLGLCLASHDIALHRTLIDNSEDEEGSYHFAVSLSILREVAQIIKQIDNLALKMHFSQKTSGLLDDLKRDLMPIQDDSLIKGSLRPIRNLTFHYDFTKADQEKIGPLLADMKNERELKVRASSGDNSILRYRYTFADAFRSQLVASYLTKDVVAQITVAAVNVIAFTDSLLADLSQ
jgi:hypothetical protein